MSSSTHVWLSTSMDPSFDEGFLDPQYKLSIANPANDFIKLYRDPVNLITVIGQSGHEKFALKKSTLTKSALANLIAGYGDENTAIFPSSSSPVREISLHKKIMESEWFSTQTNNNPVGNPYNIKLVLANVEDWKRNDSSSLPDTILLTPILLISKLVLLIVTDDDEDDYLPGQIDAMVMAANSFDPKQKFGHLAIISERPPQMEQFTRLNAIFQSVKVYRLLAQIQMRQDFNVLLKEPHTLSGQTLTGSFLAPFLDVFVANLNPHTLTKLSLQSLLEKMRKSQYQKSIIEFVILKKNDGKDPMRTDELETKLKNYENHAREKLPETITDLQFLDKVHETAYDALCSSNLEKIAPWAERILKDAIEQMEKEIQAAVPGSKPMSSKELEKIISDIFHQQENIFLAMVNRLDQAKPVHKDVTDLKKKFNEHLSKNIMRNRELWNKWVDEKRFENFKIMTDSFAKLLERMPGSYNQDLENIGSDVMWRFVSTMTAEYPEPDRERIVDDFNNEVARRVQLEKNKHNFWEIRSSETIAQYCSHLNSSLKEKVEPAPMDKITDLECFLKAFEDSCKVSGNYLDQMFIFSDKLENILRSETAKWEPRYHQAVREFRAWLQNDLESLLNDCKKAIKHEITLKTNAEVICLSIFDPPTRNYKVDSPDSYGAGLIGKYRQDLITFIKSEQNKDELDGDNFRLRNRELLISLVKHIYKKVGESSYVSTLAFEMDVKAAKERFILEAMGDPTLSDEIWQKFNVQVPSMAASVRQSIQAIPFNGKTQSELERDIADSEGFIEAIARVARGLGLSHTSEIPTFSHIIKNSVGGRENLYINDMWDPARKVCIKLYDWQLKLDDAKCDDPFIENLEPENITTILLEHYGKGTSMSHEETTGGKLNLGNAPEFGQSQVWRNFQNRGLSVFDEQNFFMGLMPTIAVPIGKKVECSLFAFKQKEIMTYTACATLVPKVYLYAYGEDGQKRHNDRDLGAANEIGLKDLGVDDYEASQPEFQDSLKLLQDIRRYQFYIRGKFERINGQVLAVKWNVTAV